jgi:hypothetical protein
VFAARYELNSYIVFRKRLVSKRLRDIASQVELPSGKPCENMNNIVIKFSWCIL